MSGVMTNNKNQSEVGQNSKVCVERKPIKIRSTSNAFCDYKRIWTVTNRVKNLFIFVKEIYCKPAATFPLIELHCFRNINMNETMNDNFHMSNLSAIRRRSSSGVIPTSGFARNSSRRRIASAYPSSSSRINSGSERRSFEARVARSEVESPSANSSTVDMFAMTTIISQVVSSFSRKLHPFWNLEKRAPSTRLLL
jgi:hypothetical protein